MCYNKLIMDIYEFVALRKKYIEQRYQFLNPVQREAAFCNEGPLLILAGAGSGKTTVLVNRISVLLRFGNAYHSDKVYGAPPDDLAAKLAAAVESGIPLTAEDERRLKVGQVSAWNIMAITFTNKAAGEMKARIATTVKGGEDVNASTFHSACVKILRRDADRIGYPNSFTIYDTDDSLRLLKQIYKDNNLDDKMLPVKGMLSSIGRIKDELVSPEEFAKQAYDYRQQVISKVYSAYEKALANNAAMDFDDLIYNTVKLFEQNPDVLQKYNDKYRYIMVDEYQDTSVAQFRLVKLLAGDSMNICVVGDDDQSIYRFRGATIENILSFERRFEGARVIRLEQNYRSTQKILDAANDVICNNSERKGKTLWTEKKDGDPVTVYIADDERDEAAYVAGKINEAVVAGASLSECAVLYRLNAQSNSIENYFARAGIPYKVVGGVRFFDRAEIKDILSYMCVIGNPNDNLRLKRIINRPSRKIGEATVLAVEQIALGLGVPMLDVIREAANYPALQRAAKPLSEFSRIMGLLFESFLQNSLSDFTRDIITVTGYEADLMSQGDEGETRLQNVREMITSVSNYCEEAEEPTLNEYLEQVALISDLDNYDSESERVTLMTLHSAKGLEFENVFMTGLEEGVFPGDQSRLDAAAIEEERRLMYVGVTRAKKRLYIISACARMLYGQTRRSRMSRFVGEISDEHKVVIDNGNYSAHSSAPAPIKTGRGIDVPVSIHKAQPAKPSGAKFEVGERVHHNVFGDGTVISATPLGGDTLLEIDFDVKGRKKTMQNYAPLSKI